MDEHRKDQEAKRIQKREEMKLIYKRYIGVKTVYYYDDFMSIDTETSHEAGYTWISSIQVYFRNQFYLFRKPMHFINFLNEIIERLDLYNQKRLICIIHNASYDLSYLIGYFQKYLPDKDDRSCIMRDTHNIVAYRQGGIDIRDTYALCNTSLEKWGKDLNVEHKKQVGLYDYNKVIYQDSYLSKDEITYDKYDVLSLYECFKKQLAIHNDTLASVPYTSTGYVRRDTAHFCRQDKYYRKKYFCETRLTLDQLDDCIMSFAGGYTHNNRFFNGKIIRGLIGHRDFRSMYPSILRCYLLPVGKPFTIFDLKNPLLNINEMDIFRLLKMSPEYYTVSKLWIKSAVLKDKKITMPFMQYSKLDVISEGKNTKCLKDNGRVLSFHGDAVINVDNFMLQILTEQYELECMVLKVIRFKTGYLPQCLCNLIDTYFKAKSDLKIEHQKNKKLYGELDERTIEAGINLMLSKQKLNGIYGMFVQNPLANEYDIDYESDEIINSTLLQNMDDEQRETELNNFYNNYNKYLPYQVGIFVTALARFELYEYIKTIGYANVYYCDTDSIFYKKTAAIEKRIEALNKKKHANAAALKAFIVNSEGKEIYYDVFEEEDDLKAFKGLHAKCYAMIEKDSDEFTCTIAGVPARTMIAMKEKPVYLTREEELCGYSADDKINNPDLKINPVKGLQNLSDKFIFNVNTGTTCNYSDYMLKEEKDVIINGHHINTFGGGVIAKLDHKQIKNMNLSDIEIFNKTEQAVI